MTSIIIIVPVCYFVREHSLYLVMDIDFSVGVKRIRIFVGSNFDRSTYLKRKRICITHQIILMKANDLETVAIDAANFLSTTSYDQSDSMS